MGIQNYGTWKENARKGVSEKTGTEYICAPKVQEEKEGWLTEKEKDLRWFREDTGRTMGCSEKWMEEDLCVGKRKR